jgi:regulatory protein
MSVNSDLKDARNRALRMLSRREYAAHELFTLLSAKGFDQTILDTLLQQLQQENLQSDARYAEAYARSRQQRGFGPLRIKQDLSHKGIAAELITDVLNHCETPWEIAIQSARSKRFGEALPEDHQSRAKQIRFLQYRGFPMELAYWAVNSSHDFS